MTAAHIAQLAYPTGEVKLVSGKAYPKTYQSAQNMLVRMAARKEVRRHRLPFGYKDYWTLPGTHGLKSIERYWHELAGADLFVSFRPVAEAWAYEPAVGPARADRGLIAWGKTYYFEVDRATEPPRTIAEKCDAYTSHARRSGERFAVVFAVAENDRQSVERRGEDIITVIPPRPGMVTFLLANCRKLTDDPTRYTLYDPARDVLVTLSAAL